MGEGHNFLAKVFLSLVALPPPPPPVNNDRSLKKWINTRLKCIIFLLVLFDERWLSVQFSSFPRLDHSRIEVWIKCIYKHFFIYIFQVIMPFKV